MVGLGVPGCSSFALQSTTNFRGKKWYIQGLVLGLLMAMGDTLGCETQDASYQMKV